MELQPGMFGPNSLNKFQQFFSYHSFILSQLNINYYWKNSTTYCDVCNASSTSFGIYKDNKPF